MYNIRILLLLVGFFILFSDSFAQIAEFGDGINFLAFGDSGWNTKYRYADMKEGAPIEKFKKRPFLILEKVDEKNNLYYEMSGINHVVPAMYDFCNGNIKKCKFAIVAGDLIYPSGFENNNEDEARFKDIMVEPFKPFNKLGGFHFYAALGNHEWYSAGADLPGGNTLEKKYADSVLSVNRLHKRLLKYPRDHLWVVNSQFNTRWNPDVLPPTWFSFKSNNGAAEFFVLDTSKIVNTLNVEKVEKDLGYPNPNILFRKKENLDAQIDWLKKSLDSSKAKWKIVVGHHPLNAKTPRQDDVIIMKKVLLGILCEKASFYVTAHEHIAQYLSQDCKKTKNKKRPPLPIILSGNSSKLDEIESKAVITEDAQLKHVDEKVWGFAHISLDLKGTEGLVQFFKVLQNVNNKPVYSQSFSTKFSNRLRRL